MTKADKTSNVGNSLPAPRAADALPFLFDDLDGFQARIAGRQIALFLDFDGTLTAIAERPELAKMSEEMRTAVRRAAARFQVSIISGRDRPDVEALVDLDNLIYAGSHGFDISHPHDHGQGAPYRETIQNIGEELYGALSSIDGVVIERKKLSVAVHYRLVAEKNVGKVNAVVEEITKKYPDIGLIAGKKVFEILPPVDWDKGKAVLWLLDRSGDNGDEVLPIYIGDDVTDEAAFKALSGKGIGIFVCGDDGRRETRADLKVRDVAEVGRLLALLAED